jgi:hypothetical protein
MAVDPKDQIQLNALAEEYVRLMQQVYNADQKNAELSAQRLITSGKLLENVERLRQELNDTVFASDSLAKSFRETLAELKNQNVALQVGRGIFKDLTSIAQDLTYFQRGLIDLEDKHFRKKQQSLNINKDNLKDLKDNLGFIDKQGQLNYNREQDLLDLQDLKNDKNIKLTKSQTALLYQLEKEKNLLFAANDALEEGLPVLQRELDISKQIYEVREDLGGLAGAAAATISQYGGDLARFLKVDDALESVRAYNQDIIKNALTSKEASNELKKFDDERNKMSAQQILNKREERELLSDQAEWQDVVNQLNNKGSLTYKEIAALNQKRLALEAKHADQLTLDNKISNQGIKIKDYEIQLTKELADIDKKEAAYKMAVIDSTNRGLTGFANKLKSLGVLVQGLGAGLKKVLTDPITIITFFIGKALEANKQAVEIGKSLGISADAASRLRENFISYSNTVNDNFINQTRLTKAQNELSKAIGLSVKFREEDLATFARLTELQGLSNEEGAKILRIASITGKTYKGYVNDVAKSAYYASVNTKQNITSREVLQTISKLSAGILVKFRGNTDALVGAVAEAKKLGLTLDQVDKVGESLLNWEQSIENELKAELLTGRQINLERARYAALTGDQLTLTREIASQVGTLAEYEGMNVLAQRSLAEAFGLSREEMSEMLLQQELINKYGKEAVDLTDEQRKGFLAAQKAKPNLTLGQYLDEQQNQLDIQTKFNNAIIKLQEIIGGLVEGPLGRLLDSLVNGLNIVTKIFGVFGQVGSAIKGIFGNKIGGLLGDVASVATIGALIALVASSLTKGTILNPIYTIPFGGITGMFKGGAGKAGGLFGTAGKSMVPPKIPPVAPVTPKIISPAKSGIIPGKGPLVSPKPALPKFNAATNRWMMNVPGTGNRIITTPALSSAVPPKISPLAPVTPKVGIVGRIGKGISAIGRGAGGIGSGIGAAGSAVAKTIGTGGILAGLFGAVSGFAKKKEEGGTTGEAVGAGTVRGGAAISGTIIGSAIGTLFGPGIGTAVGGIIGGFVGDSLGGWINKNAPGVSKRFGAFWDNISGKFSSALEPWKKVIENLKNGFNSVVESINKFLAKIGINGGLGSIFSQIADIVGESLLYPLKLIIAPFGLLADSFKALGQLLTGDVSGAVETLKNGFVNILETVFSPFLFFFDKLALGWSKIKNILPSWLGGSSKPTEVATAPAEKAAKTTANPSPAIATPVPATSPTPGLANGGEVLKTGIAKVDAGEVFLGKSTRGTFQLLANNSIAQTQYLKALIDVLSSNTLNLTPAVDAINNLSTKITNFIKPTPSPTTLTPTTSTVNFDVNAVNKLLTTPLLVNIQPLIDAIKGINIPTTITSNIKLDFTPLIDAINRINIAPTISNISPIINNQIDFTPVVDAIRKINIAPPQFNVSAEIEAPKVTLPGNEQPKTAIPQPIPQSPLPLISDTLKQIVGASSPKAVEQRPATNQQTINSNDTKSVVAAINALQNRPTVVKLYLDSKQVIEMMAKGNSSLA